MTLRAERFNVSNSKTSPVVGAGGGPGRVEDERGVEVEVEDGDG